MSGVERSVRFARHLSECGRTPVVRAGELLRRMGAAAAHTALAEGKRDEAISWVRRALAITPGDARIVEMIRALENAR